MFFGRSYLGNNNSSTERTVNDSSDVACSNCKLLCAARRDRFIWTCVRYQTPSKDPDEEQISVRCSSISSSDGDGVSGSYDFLANSDSDRTTPICETRPIPTPFVTSALFIDHRSASGLGSARKDLQDIALILGTSTGHVRFLSFNAVIEMPTPRANPGPESVHVFLKSSFSHVYHPVSVESLCTARDMSVYTQLFVLHKDSCVTQLELDVSDGISSYSELALPRAKRWQVPFCAKAIVPIPAVPIFPAVVPQSAGGRAGSERVDMLVGGKTPALAMVSSCSPSSASGTERSQSASLMLGKAILSVAGWLLSSGQSQQSSQQQQQQNGEKESQQQHLSVVTELSDPPREILSFSPSPSYQYVAAADTLGRVSIVDMAEACLVIRIFKGYRDAQCAWLSKRCLPENIKVNGGSGGGGDDDGKDIKDDKSSDNGDDDSGDELCKMILAIYTPVQSIVDLWDPLGQSPFRRIEVDHKYKIAPLYCGNVADNLVFFDVSNGTAIPLHEFVALSSCI